MQSNKLEINAGIQIQKPAREVFEAIVDPAKMCNYFISESTGRMEEGKTVRWKFPEFDQEFPVRVGKIEKDATISFYWENEGQETMTTITLQPFEINSTVVKVSEKSRDNDEAGLKWLKGNTEGWANFLACLKAYMEYGINLRKGSFDFQKQQAKKQS